MQTPISTLVQSYSKTSTAYKAWGKEEYKLTVEGLDGYPLSRFALAIRAKSGGRLWLVCPTEDSAQQLLRDYRGRDLGTKIVYLPSTGRQLYSPVQSDLVTYEQLTRLAEISHLKEGVIVTHLRPFVSTLPTPNALESTRLHVRVGDRFDPTTLSERLSEAGYVNTPSTQAAGEYTIRGEVVDIFPFEEQWPYRLYADWDTVGRISQYDPSTQQTRATISALHLTLFDEQRQVENGSIEAYIGEKDVLVWVGDQRLATSYKSLESEARSLYRQAFHADRDAPKPDELLLNYPAFSERWQRSITVRDIAGQDERAHRFDVEGPRSYFGNFILLKEDLSSLKSQGWQVHIFCDNALQRQRLSQMLGAYPFIQWEETPLSSGFALPALKVIAIAEGEIFGRRRQVIKTLQHTQSSPLDSFVDLAEGDFVVHVNYGVGQFIKIDRVSSFDRERDFIKIAYADDEILYVPIEQANLVQRYIGSDGSAVRKDKLGGQGWERKKERARKNAEELARHLIDLYARRKRSVGFAFAKDTDWQIQFEASFPFDETADQLQVIDEIKADMELPHVMDRLVCGDVGYGKTEIAFRAAFKAVMSGKQVAFLAPTTILAEQHYRTFIQRIGSYPVRSGLMSRIVTAKDQRAVRLGVAEGSIDVLFGTHRILQKDIVFRDLGLLIIDEEQRFGVKDKERIKGLRASIDSLSLSATPIPRTLYMSLLKIRDMSLLGTAPIARRSIKTVIGEWDQGTVVKAIEEEVGRGGQVFYLHNRIETLSKVVAQLQNLLPSVIIESAHGQMAPVELEDTMRRFIHQGIQVLVSTTIIENGIDIPNVNTIIIDRADRYGLGQLYQLRGRVGRSDRQAFAYLLYPAETALTEVAIKRLKILSEHTGLGSGFKVALKDMEIRGAGNLLGREQSGHLASVGLDMYIRILDETIKRLEEGGLKEEDREVFLELEYTGFIPESYIKAPSVKFEIYRKIASIASEEELHSLTSELSDRYGTPPVEVANLLYIAEIKIICRKLSIIRLTERRQVVAVEFGKVADLNIQKVMNLIALSAKSIWLDPRQMNVMYMKLDAVSLKDKALFLMEKLQRLL
ncbi:MAG: transcription-repair coupling factor [Sphaerochaeta sp.]|jgi:transcription-repair coupling factor (superfamily II helicase)